MYDYFTNKNKHRLIVKNKYNYMAIYYKNENKYKYKRYWQKRKKKIYLYISRVRTLTWNVVFPLNL